MKEQDIQSLIIKGLQARNYYVIKIMVASKAGVPDIIACSPTGRFIAIEVKCPGELLSKLQEVNIRKIRKCQGISFIATSWKDVLNQIE